MGPSRLSHSSAKSLAVASTFYACMSWLVVDAGATYTPVALVWPSAHPLSFISFSFSSSFSISAPTAKPQPKTMSKEWKAAEKEKMKASGANPLRQ